MAVLNNIDQALADLYKFNNELTMVFMSCNLVGGMFQRLEKMKKNAFASAILFGENNNSIIKAAFLYYPPSNSPQKPHEQKRK